MRQKCIYVFKEMLHHYSNFSYYQSFFTIQCVKKILEFFLCTEGFTCTHFHKICVIQ